MTNNKIICIISDSEPILDVRKFYRDAYSLSQNGYKVFYISDGQSPRLNPYPDITIIPINKFTFLPTNPFSHIMKLWMALKVKADIYQIYSPYLLPFGAVIKLISKKPIIFVSLEDYSAGINDDTTNGEVKKLMAKILVSINEYLFLNCMTRVITSDESITKYYTSKIRTISKISTIYNFPRTDIFNPNNTGSEIYDSNNRFVIMYHGSISAPRGIIQLAKAASISSKKIPNLKLLIIGFNLSGKMKNYLNLISATSENKDLIEIHEQVGFKKIPYYLNTCHIGIIPFTNTVKLQHNIPQKMFEYMACKKAIIASNLPPIKQFLDKSKAGILVPPNNIKKLSTAIEQLYYDNAKRKEMGENGFEYIKKKWNWGVMELKYIKVVKEIVASD